jgi:PA14 domain/Divergent InlB B-repeat domain
VASEILYCARCHRVILPREIADGEYHFVDGDPVCRECFTRLSRRLRPVTGSRAESNTQPIPVDLADLEEELAKGTDGTQAFTPVTIKEKPTSSSRLQGYHSYRQAQTLFMGACFLIGLVLGAVAYSVSPLDTSGGNRRPPGNGRARPINGTGGPVTNGVNGQPLEAPKGGYLIDVEADATVDISREENHGADVMLTLTHDARGPTSEAYLRFDLSAINKPVEKAELHLGVVLIQEGQGVTQEALLVPPQEEKWNEVQINWANRPPVGKVLCSWPLPTGGSTRADVTAAVQEALFENRSKLSLCLRLAGNTTAKPKVMYISREDRTGNAPALLIWPGKGKLVRKAPEKKPDPVEKSPDKHKLTVTVEGQGSVELDPPGGSYQADVIVTLKAIPEKGALFGGWLDGSGSKENPRRLTVQGPVEVSARFNPVPASKSEPPPVKLVSKRLNLKPVADTYTYAGQKNVNNGTDPELRVANYGPKSIRQAYLRFDLSKVKGSVKAAQLFLFPFKQTGSGVAPKHTLALVSDNSWQENKLTASATPKSGNGIETWEPRRNKLVTIDVAKQVRAALAGDKQLSLELSAPYGSPRSIVIYYGSREAEKKEHRPLLVVTSEVKSEGKEKSPPETGKTPPKTVKKPPPKDPPVERPVPVRKNPRNFHSLLASADAYVYDGHNSARNFGRRSYLYVRYEPNIKQEAFIRFDLSRISGKVFQARAMLTIQNVGPDIRNGVKHEASLLKEAPWDESKITWKDHPKSERVVGTWIAKARNQVVSVDLTRAVKEALAKKKKSLSLRIRALKGWRNSYVSYAAREGQLGQPRLVVLTGAALPGLKARFYRVSTRVSSVPELGSRSPELSRVDAQVNYPLSKAAWKGLAGKVLEAFAARHTGLLRIDRSGTYTFHLASDDGSRLWLNDSLVVDNGGLHTFEEKSGKIHLKTGYHLLRMDFFTRGGESGLTLKYEGPAVGKQLIPAGKLFHVDSPEDDLITVKPAADVYVVNRTARGWRGSFYGKQPTLSVSLQNDTHCFLRFDLADVKLPIASARLRLKQTGSFPLSIKAGFKAPHALFFVAANNWDELKVDYKNRPKPGDRLGSFNAESGKPVEVDITARIRKALAGDKVISLCIRPGKGFPAKLTTRFYSRESGPHRGPQLLIMPQLPKK